MVEVRGFGTLTRCAPATKAPGNNYATIAYRGGQISVTLSDPQAKGVIVGSDVEFAGYITENRFGKDVVVETITPRKAK